MACLQVKCSNTKCKSFNNVKAKILNLTWGQVDLGEGFYQICP
jgi:hypothetical protein